MTEPSIHYITAKPRHKCPFILKVIILVYASLGMLVMATAGGIDAVKSDNQYWQVLQD